MWERRQRWERMPTLHSGLKIEEKHRLELLQRRRNNRRTMLKNGVSVMTEMPSYYFRMLNMDMLLRRWGWNQQRFLQFRLPPLTIEGIHHSDADSGRGGAQQGSIKNNCFAFYIICEYDRLPGEYSLHLWIYSTDKSSFCSFT